MAEASNRLLDAVKLEVEDGAPTVTNASVPQQQCKMGYSPYCNCDLCPCCGKLRSPYHCYPWGTWPYWQTWIYPYQWTFTNAAGSRDPNGSQCLGNE